VRWDRPTEAINPTPIVPLRRARHLSAATAAAQGETTAFAADANDANAANAATTQYPAKDTSIETPTPTVDDGNEEGSDTDNDDNDDGIRVDDGVDIDDGDDNDNDDDDDDDDNDDDDDDDDGDDDDEEDEEEEPKISAVPIQIEDSSDDGSDDDSEDESDAEPTMKRARSASVSGTGSAAGARAPSSSMLSVSPSIPVNGLPKEFESLVGECAKTVRTGNGRAILVILHDLNRLMEDVRRGGTHAAMVMRIRIKTNTPLTSQFEALVDIADDNDENGGKFSAEVHAAYASFMELVRKANLIGDISPALRNKHSSPSGGHGRELF